MMRTAPFHLENHFIYHWNSSRRRAHILVTILATLTALAICAATSVSNSFAAPLPAPLAAKLPPAVTEALAGDIYVFGMLANGSDLYVAGNFTTIGGIKANSIARYNMTTGQWAVIGGDAAESGNGTNGTIRTMALVGNDLYVGGSFTRVFNSLNNSISANCVAKFNLQTKTWSALGTGTAMNTNGINGDCLTIAVANGGVYFGGHFDNAFNSANSSIVANNIACWKNNTWTPLGKGLASPGTPLVLDLAVIGTDLYVGGAFATVTNANDSKLYVDCIAKWSTVNSTWSALGAVGDKNGFNGVNGDVLAMAVNGNTLYVGGTFPFAHNTNTEKVLANHLATWNGTTWGVLGNPSSTAVNGVNGTVTELLFTDNSLYVGGLFTSGLNTNGATNANGVARWTGSSWSALGTGVGSTGNGVNDEVLTMVAGGSNVYVGGNYTEAYNNTSSKVTTDMLARWNGTAWSTLSGSAVKSLAMLSAASFSTTGFSAEGIVAGYGTGLASGTVTATATPLPTTLGGTSVAVRDSAGTSRSAPLFFVSGGQVNFQIPLGTTAGNATVTITAGDGSLSEGTINVQTVAPGLFTMNSNGSGVVAGGALRVSGATQTYETIATLNTTTNRWATKPINLGPATDTVFLIVYGTAFRNRTALSNVTATIGGTAAPVSFAGKQGGLVGVDQANIQIPRSLIGRGEVDLILTVDGKAANTVKVNIQ